MNKTLRTPFSKSFQIDSFEESLQLSAAGNTSLTFLAENSGEEYTNTTLKLIAQSRHDSDFESSITLSNITEEGCDLLISKFQEIKKFLRRNE